MHMGILAGLKEAGVVPVAVFDSVDDSLRVSEMLLERGIGMVEITMRTSAALDCMEAVAAKVPEITMGAGSVFDSSMLRDARQAGAGFAVAAGFDMETVQTALDLDFPFVPGIATPSELMAALKYCSVIKVFPVALLGGVPYINAGGGPLCLQGLSSRAHRGRE